MFSTSGYGAPSDLDEAERILTEAATLSEFLENPELQRRYYESIRAYLGPKRDIRSSFQNRIDTLRQILPTIPKLEERLWRRNPPEEPFELESQAISYARGVDVEAKTLLNQSKRKFLATKIFPVRPSPLKSGPINDSIRRCGTALSIVRFDLT